LHTRRSRTVASGPSVSPASQPNFRGLVYGQKLSADRASFDLIQRHRRCSQNQPGADAGCLGAATSVDNRRWVA
jgi:hypothetical protein